MDNIFFSIIVPVFNCEKYLERALVSILSQKFINFELLLIDDGSTDTSGKICDDYMLNDKRVKVYHKENTGVSDTRNFGIKKSKGKYLTFFDSDDYVEDNYLLDMYNILLKYDCDLINSGFFSEVENKNRITYDLVFSDEKFYKNKDEIISDLVYLWDKHMLYNVWNKIYSSNIIKGNNIFFPEFNFGEDMWFNQQYIKKINNFYNTSNCYYHYIKERKDSITAKFNPELFDLRKKEFYDFNEYFKENNLSEEQYLEFSSRRFFERTIGCIENICSSSLPSSKKNLLLERILNDPLTIYTNQNAIFKSKKMKMLSLVVNKKSVLLSRIVFYFISKVRKTFPGLFNKLKNRR